MMRKKRTGVGDYVLLFTCQKCWYDLSYVGWLKIHTAYQHITSYPSTAQKRKKSQIPQREI